MKDVTRKKPAFKDNLIEVEITSLAAGGKGVGRNDGKVVFVEKGIPGQRVRVQLYKDRKDYSEGRVIELLENSSFYEEPRCPHFAYCGGCSLQNMKYEEQVKQKKKLVIEALCRIGGVDNAPVQDTIPSPDQYYYRNKMEFSFSNKVWDAANSKIQNNAFGLGLHLPGRYDTVINIKECFLQSEVSSKILLLIRDITEESGLPVYDLQKHRGFWRYLVIREGKKTKECLINLITNKCDDSEKSIVEEIVKYTIKKFPGINSFFHAEHPGKSQAATWDSIRLLHGGDYINELIGDHHFRINCETFFQTNSAQVENLYDQIENAGNFSGTEIVYDLYSGVGTIPVHIASMVKKVVGFEINSDSVAGARTNAKFNNITNCCFIQGKVRALLKQTNDLIRKYGKPDVVITDPPRSGMDPKTIERVIKLSPGKIIYVSCNPATLARDIKLFANEFHLENVVPVDMFPHTAHIESVTTLIRKAQGNIKDNTGSFAAKSDE